MKIVHIVRRFGPVGGMERYVYELVSELCLLGHDVAVVCEEVACTPPSGLTVHRVEKSFARPRWFALMRFGQKVSAWLQKNPHPGWLIHSHERMAVHHISTYHGQPFATVFDGAWLKLLSLRVFMHLQLERREISNSVFVVPNSDLTRQQLLKYYPEYSARIVSPIFPGAECDAIRPARRVPETGGTIAFVGKEWVRKGLPFATEVVRQLRMTRPNLRFAVLGPEPDEIKHLFSGWAGGYELAGWVDNPRYSDFDVLLHPAKSEPFGMVVTEALAANVRVVVSDKCGVATSVHGDMGKVMSLAEPVRAWVNALESVLNETKLLPFHTRSWQSVAQEYQALYETTVIQRADLSTWQDSGHHGVHSGGRLNAI